MSNTESTNIKKEHSIETREEIKEKNLETDLEHVDLPFKMTAEEFSVESTEFKNKKASAIAKMNSVRTSMGAPESNETSVEIVETERKLRNKAVEAGLDPTELENTQEKSNTESGSKLEENL